MRCRSRPLAECNKCRYGFAKVLRRRQYRYFSFVMSVSSPPPENKSAQPPKQPATGDTCEPPAGNAVALSQPVNIIPVAPLHWRLLAAVMDGVLLFFFVLFLLTKVLLPMQYPAAYTEFREIFVSHVDETRLAQEEKRERPPLPDISDNVQITEMVSYGMQVAALCALVYFVACERFLQGGSLGKSMFRLRVISLRTGRRPSIWESFLRNLIKICALVMPLLWINYLVALANKMHRAGHDLLSQTIVVSDTAYVPQLIEPRRRTAEDEDRSV